MADDDKKMTVADATVGVVTGAGTAAVASGIYGATQLKGKSFADLAAPIKTAAKEAAGENGLFAKVAKAHGVTQQAISKAYASPATLEAFTKVATDRGIDVAEIMKNAAGRTGGLGAEELEAATHMGGAANFKAAHEVFSKVAEQLKSPADIIKLKTDVEKALVGAVKIEGKTAEESAKIVTELHSGMGKTVATAFNAVENTGRKIIGALKYEGAKWYQKPAVAFEAMSTKGKAGVVFGAVAATAVGAMAANRMFGHNQAPEESQSR